MSSVKINLNDRVTFDFNDKEDRQKGEAILIANGLSEDKREMQLYEFMNIFGPFIRLYSSHSFLKTTVKISSDCSTYEVKP